MTRNERKALTAQLARRLDERPDMPIMARLGSILRARKDLELDKTHPYHLADEELYMLLNQPKAAKEEVGPA